MVTMSLGKLPWCIIMMGISGLILGDPLVKLPLGTCPGLLPHKLVCMYSTSGFILGDPLVTMLLSR